MCRAAKMNCVVALQVLGIQNNALLQLVVRILQIVTSHGVTLYRH
uniref:Uncharacterized protein n=1 Tax=Arundo donax TaxID=35708 RepID=A0A0A9A1S5_ARUDO